MLEILTNHRQHSGHQKSLGRIYFTLRWLTWLFVLIFLVSMCVWGWNKLEEKNVFAVKEIKVIGSYPHINKINMQQTILPFVEKGFFNVDITRLRDRLLLEPWIADVAISRVWPYKLVIRISERKPVAYWGDDTLLNEDGFLFSPPKETFPLNLPKIKGPKGQQLQTLEIYKQVSSILETAKLGVTTFEVTPRQAVYLRLDNGISLIVGREAMAARLQRFISIFPSKLSHQEKSIRYVDLRYPNGMAISWLKEDTNIYG